MNLKTSEYTKFILRADNRATISQEHVNKLADSISERNLLDLKPIIVNENMEIVDGQHRFLACQQLNIPVVYTIKKNLGSREIILLSNSKAWALIDYFNHYSKLNYPEYVKLDKFIKENLLSFKIAVRIIIGSKFEAVKKFKNGEFIFTGEGLDELLSICRRTQEIIERNHGRCPWTNATRFWNAMIRVFNDANFNEEKWFFNLTKNVEMVQQKATTAFYIAMLIKIHNWRNNSPIEMYNLDTTHI